MEYSASELMDMQNEAIENARRMQERAQKTEKEPKAGSTHTNEHYDEAPKTGQGKEKIQTDSDKAIILPLLLLLMKEGADKKLLLALMYIMA